MKLNSFKFQDGKIFWLPEYPEKEVKKCENACEYCEYVCADYYEYRKAVTKSLASAIEVAPEDADVVKIQIWWHNIWTPGLDKQHANQNTFNQIIELWQPENGKVYNAECEMEIKTILESLVSDLDLQSGKVPIGTQIAAFHKVARLKSK